jgi:hypothetical protein
MHSPGKWPKGGLSLPNLSSASGTSGVSRGYKTISGPDIAIFAGYSWSEKFSLNRTWNGRPGWTENQLQTIPAIPDLAQFFHPAHNTCMQFTSTVRLQYLMLPLMIKYTIDIGRSDKWKLYVDGGVYGALLITANASASGSSKSTSTKTTQPLDPSPSILTAWVISGTNYKGTLF